MMGIILALIYLAISSTGNPIVETSNNVYFDQNINAVEGLEETGRINPSCTFPAFVKMLLCIDKSIKAAEFPPGEDYGSFLISYLRRMGMSYLPKYKEYPEPKEGTKIPVKCLDEAIFTFQDCSVRPEKFNLPTDESYLPEIDYQSHSQRPTKTEYIRKSAEKDCDQSSSEESDSSNSSEQRDVEDVCFYEAMISMSSCIDETYPVDSTNSSEYLPYFLHVIHFLNNDVEDWSKFKETETDVEAPEKCMEDAIQHYMKCANVKDASLKWSDESEESS